MTVMIFWVFCFMLFLQIEAFLSQHHDHFLFRSQVERSMMERVGIFDGGIRVLYVTGMFRSYLIINVEVNKRTLL